MDAIKAELDEKSEFVNKMRSADVEMKAALEDAQQQLNIRAKQMKKFENDINCLKLQKTG